MVLDSKQMRPELLHPDRILCGWKHWLIKTHHMTLLRTPHWPDIINGSGPQINHPSIFSQSEHQKQSAWKAWRVGNMFRFQPKPGMLPIDWRRDISAGTTWGKQSLFKWWIQTQIIMRSTSQYSTTLWSNQNIAANLWQKKTTTESLGGRGGEASSLLMVWFQMHSVIAARQQWRQKINHTETFSALHGS